MNVTNKMQLKFESKAINEGFARQAVAAFVSQLDPTMDELNDIKTVVSEAVTNAVVHGYKDAIGYIFVTVKIIGLDTVEIIVRDKGCGIPNIKQAMEPMYTTGNEERSGMGFTIMESFMDKLRIRSKIGKGTTVSMTRRIDSKLSGGK